jgi:hypothetical protein
MKHTHGDEVLVLALIACLTACADSVSSPTGPGITRDVRSEPASVPPSPERAALSRVARLVAVSMDNEPARQHLKRDLKAAPFREHKLELRAYLQSKDGRALLNRMVAVSGGSERDLLASLYAIRPLEFYMPVAKHRESWTGSADVLVVSQLSEPDPIVAFDESGREIVLDRTTAPAQPTLTIVPVETRFDEPMAPAGSKNVRDQGGSSIGTLEPMVPRGASMIACGDECGGGGGGGGGGVAPVPPGLYLEFSRILDMKEPWFRGDPEIEVHIHGPTEPGNTRYGADLSCSGEHSYDQRKVFDQNGAFWEGRVLLFSAEETAAYVAQFNDGFHVFFWEDDNDSCTIKLDNTSLLALLQSTASAFSTVALKLIPKAPVPLVAGVFLATLFANSGQWLLTNDDFLGVAVDLTSAGYNYPGNTHVIMDGTTLNGRATIVYRR